MSEPLASRRRRAAMQRIDHRRIVGRRLARVAREFRSASASDGLRLRPDGPAGVTRQRRAGRPTRRAGRQSRLQSAVAPPAPRSARPVASAAVLVDPQILDRSRSESLPSRAGWTQEESSRRPADPACWRGPAQDRLRSDGFDRGRGVSATERRGSTVRPRAATSAVTTRIAVRITGANRCCHSGP